MEQVGDKRPAKFLPVTEGEDLLELIDYDDQTSSRPSVRQPDAGRYMLRSKKLELMLSLCELLGIEFCSIFGTGTRPWKIQSNFGCERRFHYLRVHCPNVVMLVPSCRYKGGQIERT